MMTCLTQVPAREVCVSVDDHRGNLSVHICFCYRRTCKLSVYMFVCCCCCNSIYLCEFNLINLQFMCDVVFWIYMINETCSVNQYIHVECFISCRRPILEVKKYINIYLHTSFYLYLCVASGENSNQNTNHSSLIHPILLSRGCGFSLILKFYFNLMYMFFSIFFPKKSGSFAWRKVVLWHVYIELVN